jgi:hypothetical protein
MIGDRILADTFKGEHRLCPPPADLGEVELVSVAVRLK